MKQGEARNKLRDFDEALDLVLAGSTVGLGGMMLYRRPVDACQKLAATHLTDLTVVTFSAGFETELLVRSGSVATLRTCYAGLEVFGPAPIIRAAVQDGELALIDETELTLAAGLQATAMDVPWIPSAHGVIGTDYEKVRTDLVVFDDDISGKRLIALPAIDLDVCILHVPYADYDGNAVFGSASALDREMAAAARQTIISADQVLEPISLARKFRFFDLLSFQVSAVVEARDGARPTACSPHYPYDGQAILDYLDAVHD